MSPKFITSHILNRLIEVLAGIGAQPLFVYLATGDEMINSALASKGEEFLREFCQKNRNVEFFSTRQDFLEAARSGVRLKTDGHWDAEVIGS
jgi:hypothetical protein